MGANPAGSLELAMTHYADGKACDRPAEVRAMVDRLMRWSSQPDTCQSCSAAPAYSVVSGVALCGRCRENRAVRMVDTDYLTSRTTERIEPLAGRTLLGHGIVFDQWSLDLGGFVERVRPQAVNRMINGGADVRGLWNHNSDLPIGRSTSLPRNMRYWKDDKGVAVSIAPPSWAAGYIETVERGDVSGMSFGFRMIEDEWFMDGQKPKRDLLDMSVSEFSFVAFPAYPQTDAGVGLTSNRTAWLQKKLELLRAR